MTGYTTTAVFFGLTLCVFGFAAVMTGLALANNWRPWRQVLLYTVLLGAADRFLVYALFDGPLLSVTGYLIDTIALLLITSSAYRIARVRKMTSQYPWRYRRRGWLGWTSSDGVDQGLMAETSGAGNTDRDLIK